MRETFSIPGDLIGIDVAQALAAIWNPRFAAEAVDHFRHTLETGESYHANNAEERRNRPGVEAYD